jgi:hypothetical protein
MGQGLITRRNLMRGSIGVGAAAVIGGSAYALGPSYGAAVDKLWRHVEPDGPRDLNYLVHYARLAANSHNTQPWLFSLDGSRVSIGPDMTRATPVVDPDGHHLYASLGCAAENLSLAAGAAGAAATISLDDDSGRVEIDLAQTAPSRDPLFDAILERQSTRSDYDGRALPAADLEAISEAASIDGCEVMLLTDKAKIDQVLELAVAANTHQVDDSAFVRELRKWLRFNGAQAIDTRDGLYVGCTGNPSLPPWLGQMLFGFFLSAESENDKLVRQVRSSAGLAILVSDRDDKPHWVTAGRASQRFALKAASLGVRHAFVNQTVEVAETRRQLADLLGLGDRRPDLVMRFGYAPPMPKSLRRPVEAVIA